MNLSAGATITTFGPPPTLNTTATALPHCGEHYQPIQERMPGCQWVRPADIPDGTETGGWPDLDSREWVALGTRPEHHAKFYTIHLADPRVSGETKEVIAKVSGLRFIFDDGRVGWEPYAAGAQS